MTVVKTRPEGAQTRSPAIESDSVLQAVSDHAGGLALFRRQSPTLVTLSAAIAAARASASHALEVAIAELPAAATLAQAAAERAASFADQLPRLIEIRDSVEKKSLAAVAGARETLRACTEAGDDAGAATAADKLANLEHSASEAGSSRRAFDFRVDALRTQSASAAEQASAAEESAQEAGASLTRAKFGLIAIERDAAVCEAIAMDAYLRSVSGPPGGPGLSLLARGRVEYLVGESGELLTQLGRGPGAPLHFNAQAVDRIALGHNVIPS